MSRRDPLRGAATLLRGPSSPLPHDIGLPLADWLDVMWAGIARSWSDTPEDSLPIPYQRALATARAILGRQP